MNILQVVRTECAPSTYNRADGTGRVITELSRYFINTFHDTCYLGYYRSNEIGELASEFSDSILLTTPIDNSALSSFLHDHSIDLIQYNVQGKQYIQHIPSICEAAHAQHIPVVYCFHNMPGGTEFCNYSSFDNIVFSFTHRKSFGGKIKFWSILKSKPLSEVIIRKKTRAKYNIAYQNCDRIALFVEPYIDKYLRIVKGDNRNKFIAIPNPLSFSKFENKETVMNKNKNVIWVGRVEEGQKRVSLALKIWKLVEQNPLLDEWTFSIVGNNGPDEEYYHWLVKKYHLKRVSFEGHQDPKPYYKQAAIMISTSAYEGWPMVFMEAMPMGCCCLAFDSYDAVHEMVKDGYDGCIIPDNDIQMYYERMAQLMLDNDARVQMGMNAIDSSARFTMDKIGAKWRALYEEVVQKKSAEQ